MRFLDLANEVVRQHCWLQSVYSRLARLGVRHEFVFRDYRAEAPAGKLSRWLKWARLWTDPVGATRAIPLTLVTRLVDLRRPLTRCVVILLCGVAETTTATAHAPD